MKGRRWSWRSADKALGVWLVFPVWAVVAVSIVACVAGVDKAGASCPPLVGTWLEFDGCENCPGAEA